MKLYTDMATVYAKFRRYDRGATVWKGGLIDSNHLIMITTHYDMAFVKPIKLVDTTLTIVDRETDTVHTGYYKIKASDNTIRLINPKLIKLAYSIIGKDVKVSMSEDGEIICLNRAGIYIFIATITPP